MGAGWNPLSMTGCHVCGAMPHHHAGWDPLGIPGVNFGAKPPVVVAPANTVFPYWTYMQALSWLPIYVSATLLFKDNA